MTVFHGVNCMVKKSLPFLHLLFLKLYLQAESNRRANSLPLLFWLNIFSAKMSRAALGRSNHLSSRYRGSFLGTKEPGREANHASPPSAMLEMYFFIPCLIANPDRSVSMSVCQCVRNKCSSNGRSIGKWKIREVCSKNTSLVIFIIAVASMLILDGRLGQNYQLWDRLSRLRFISFSSLSYEYFVVLQ
jgi:hypothetical protein